MSEEELTTTDETTAPEEVTEEPASDVATESGDTAETAVSEETV